MKSLPSTPRFLDIARRVIWFEPPEIALAAPVRLLAYAMAYGSAEDMAALHAHVGDDGLREALDLAPPGVIPRLRPRAASSRRRKRH